MLNSRISEQSQLQKCARLPFNLSSQRAPYCYIFSQNAIYLKSKCKIFPLNEKINLTLDIKKILTQKNLSLLSDEQMIKPPINLCWSLLYSTASLDDCL